MKTIQPVNVWFDGKQVQAAVLSASAGDNLKNNAEFSYYLLEIIPIEDAGESLQVVAKGTLNMSGVVYDQWDTNDYAYNWIADQLNLTITGEYIRPVLSQSNPTTEPKKELTNEPSYNN